jgi:hypothetical protein
MPCPVHALSSQTLYRRQQQCPARIRTDTRLSSCSLSPVLSNLLLSFPACLPAVPVPACLRVSRVQNPERSERDTQTDRQTHTNIQTHRQTESPAQPSPALSCLHSSVPRAWSCAARAVPVACAAPRAQALEVLLPSPTQVRPVHAYSAVAQEQPEGWTSALHGLGTSVGSSLNLVFLQTSVRVRVFVRIQTHAIVLCRLWPPSRPSPATSASMCPIV